MIYTPDQVVRYARGVSGGPKWRPDRFTRKSEYRRLARRYYEPRSELWRTGLPDRPQVELGGVHLGTW